MKISLLFSFSLPSHETPCSPSVMTYLRHREILDAKTAGFMSIVWAELELCISRIMDYLKLSRNRLFHPLGMTSLFSRAPVDENPSVHREPLKHECISKRYVFLK